MKTNPPLLVTLLAAVALSATLPVKAADAVTKSSGTSKTGTTQTIPAKTPDKPEPAATIDGIVLNRPSGGFLGLTLVNNNFKLSFYDAKKKPANVDVTRAIARWPAVHKTGDERTVLNPTADGKALASTWYVHGPYVFKLRISLFVQDQENAVESYVIDFHQ